jgi:O-succinylbenzoic acid--CoA ligase
MDFLHRAAQERPDAAALMYEGRTFTSAELDHAASVIGRIVADSGLSDTTVAFWGGRDPATVAAVWGIPRGGARAMPVDPAMPPARSMEITRRHGARGLWAVPDGGIEGLLRRSPREPGRWGPPHADARYLVLTSGTTGGPKGVILTGGNVDASTSASERRLGNGRDDAWLAVLPVYSIGGLSILWRQARAGAPVVLHPAFDPGAVGAATARWVSLVPTMLRRLLDDGAAPAGLRGALVGGGPADPDLLRRALDAGIPVLQTYGMTETTSQVATVAPGAEAESMGTAGRPLDGAEVRISADGRIEVRGPMVSPGYDGEPERRAGEWFTTGDLGSIDDAGRLVVHGRADRMIVTGGRNVSPEAVEEALTAHPGVEMARVAGEPDPEWGTRVVAEFVGTADPDEVRRWLSGRLPAHEIPKDIRRVEEVRWKLEGR